MLSIRCFCIAIACGLVVVQTRSIAAEFEIPNVAQPGENGYVSGELIYPLEDKPTPQCHASTLAELPDGTLVAAWFGGSHEKNRDVGIWFSRREKTGWSKPVELVEAAFTVRREGDRRVDWLVPTVGFVPQARHRYVFSLPVARVSRSKSSFQFSPRSPHSIRESA